MKKLIALLLAAMMVFALCACGASEEPAAEEQPAAEAPAEDAAEAPAEEEAPVIKVGIAAPDVTHGWVAGVAYYAEKYCKDNNLEYKITTSADAAEMTAALQDLMAWGATVVVSWPQWTGMETALQEVIDAGIPVVNFDVDVDCEGIYKVTGDNYDMGYQCAKYIADKVGDGAIIAVMDVPSSGSVCELRKEGFYAYMDEVGYDQSNIFEVTLDGFPRDDGLAVMADTLEKYPQIDAVFSMDDETSIGSIQAITEAGRTDIKAITGGGGCQEYFNIIKEKADEIHACSALYSPLMIKDCLDVALSVLGGETVDAVKVIPSQIVDATNVDEYIDPSNTIY